MLFKYSHFCFSGKKLNARRVSSSHYRVSLLSVIVDDRQNDHQDLQFKAWPKLHWSRLEPREISPKEGWLTSYWCEQHSSLFLFRYFFVFVRLFLSLVLENLEWKVGIFHRPLWSFKILEENETQLTAFWLQLEHRQSSMIVVTGRNWPDLYNTY